MTSCEKEVEIDKKLNNYLNTTGISNNMLRQHKPLMKTRIKLHNTLTLTALLYGSKNQTIKPRDAGRIIATEMKRMRKTAGCTWTNYKTNTKITKELNMILVLEKKYRNREETGYNKENAP